MNELETLCPLRFSDLERKLNRVTHKVLTRQLRRLEESNLIVRQVYPEVPVRVEYALSSKGEELKPLLLMLNEWGWTYFRSEA